MIEADVGARPATCEPMAANVRAEAMSGRGGRYGAYIKGSNAAECDTGNGSTSCLVGKFVDILSSGTVGPGAGSGTGNKALGVQLIR